MAQLTNKETLHALGVLLIHLEETEGQLILTPEEKAIVEAVAKNVLNIDDSKESVQSAEESIKETVIGLVHKLKDEIIGIFHHQKETVEANAETTAETTSEPVAEAQTEPAQAIAPEKANEPTAPAQDAQTTTQQ